MDIEFIENPGVALLKKDKALVVGDLHIGNELALAREGVHVTGAEKALGTKILAAYRESGAERIVLLGDIKAGITYPDIAEYQLLREFFKPLSGIELHIAKGNHDSHLQEVLKQINVEVHISNEIILGSAAFIHGTSMPSEEAMRKRFLFAAHLHALVRTGNSTERVWVASNTSADAREAYEKYNKSMKLFIAPAANGLLGGKAIYDGINSSYLLFRKHMFNFRSAKAYSLSGELLGTVGKFAKQSMQ